MTIDHATLAAMAAQLQGLSLSPERAEELAAEIDRLNRACLEAVKRFPALDDPRRFLSLLVELRSPDGE